ncbi:hypothetical protein HDV05_002453 [Chytridiales sp. JEL 0842]|nr:hypothetical protein HDV05_002453 [Chytridiales sp. JEL 0842]
MTTSKSQPQPSVIVTSDPSHIQYASPSLHIQQQIKPSSLVSSHIQYVCRRRVLSSATTSSTRPPTSRGPRRAASAGLGAMGPVASNPDIGFSFASLESMGSLLEGLDSRFPEIYRNWGVCAAIHVPGYTALMEVLAQRGDVNADLVLRSLEGHFNTILEIVGEHSGDVIKLHGDAVVVAWRVIDEPSPSYHEDTTPPQLTDDLQRKLAAASKLAMLCCIEISRVLNQTEIWALEDLSDAFQGLKLQVRCAIACGELNDLHVGIDGVRLGHIVTGQATREMTYLLKKGPGGYDGVCIMATMKAWQLATAGLAKLNLKITETTIPADDNITPILSSFALFQTPPSTLSSVITRDERLNSIKITGGATAGANLSPAKKSLNRSQMGIESLVSKYIPDSALFHTRNKYGSSAAKHSPPLEHAEKDTAPKPLMASWHQIAVISVSLKNTKGWKKEDAGKNVEMMDLAMRLQLAYTIIVKWNKSRNMETMALVNGSDKSVNISCVLGLPPYSSGIIDDMGPAAIYTALGIREEFLKNHQLIGDFSIAISMGTAYVGLIVKPSRVGFRVVGAPMEIAFKLSDAGLVEGRDTILAESIGVWKSCVETHLEYQFDGEQNVDLHREGIPASSKAAVVVGGKPKWQAQHSFTIQLRSMPRWNIKPKGTTLSVTAVPESRLLQDDDGILGYTAEKERTLRACQEFVMEGKPTTLVITGGEGMGKTAFVRMIKKKLERHGISICSAKAPDADMHSLLYPFNCIVPQLMTLMSNLIDGGAFLKSDSQDSMVDKGGRWMAASAFMGSLIGAKNNPLAELMSNPQLIESNLDEAHKCLRAAAEDASVALPLLSAVMPFFVKETRFTTTVGPDGRIALLCGVLERLINFFVKSRHLAIIIDDIHRMDSASWQLMMNIARRCPKCILVLTSRPPEDYREHLMQDLIKLEQTTEIQLNGLLSRDVDSFLQKKFGDRAASIGPDVTDALVQRTAGCPLMLELLSLTLPELPSLTVKNGMVMPYVSKQDLLDSLPNTITDALSINFDKITSPDFKHLLKCASIVGSRFSLNEIGVLWEEPTHDLSLASRELIKAPKDGLLNRLETLLKLYDVYGFIEFLTDPLQGADGLSAYPNVFAFRASAARDHILSRFKADSISQRARHARLIALYESMLTDDNESTLIPLLCPQYAAAQIPDRTSVHKRIQYLEMIGTYMVLNTQSYVEARKVYVEMKALVESSKMQEDFTDYILAEWEARLAQAFGHGLPREVDSKAALQHAIAGLELLKVKFPRKDSEWNRMATKESLLFFVNNVFYWTLIVPKKLIKRWVKKHELQHVDRTVKGRKKKTTKVAPKPKSQIIHFEDSMQKERLEKLIPILELVSDHLFRTHANLRDQICFDLFSLNTALRMGRNVNQAKGRVMANLAFKLWFANRYERLSKGLAHEAERRILKVNDDMVAPAVLVTLSQFLIASGDWPKAHQYTEKGMFLSARKGELVNWLVSASQRAFMHIFDGALKAAFDIEVECQAECDHNGFKAGLLWTKIICAYIKVLQRDYNYVSSVQKDLVNAYVDANTQQKAAIEGIFANQFVQCGDVESATRAISTIVTLLNKIDYENTQALHGIFLAVLAMFDAWKEASLPTRAFSISGPSGAPPPFPTPITPTQSSSDNTNASIAPSYAATPIQPRRVSLMPSDALSITSVPVSKRTVIHSIADEEEEEEDCTTKDRQSPRVQSNMGSYNSISPDPDSGELVSGNMRGISFAAQSADGKAIEPSNRKTSMARSTKSLRKAFKAMTVGRNAATVDPALPTTGSNAHPSSPPTSTSTNRNTSLRSQTSSYMRSLYRKVQPTMNNDTVDYSMVKAKENLLESANALLNAMKPIEKHIVAVPIMGMLRAFIKMGEGSPRDAAVSLREKYRSLERSHPNSMGLLVGVMAMKAWDASDKSEAWRPELSKGSLILTLAGMMEGMKQ